MTICLQCGTELRTGDPEGLCPGCLLAGAVDADFTFREPPTQTIYKPTQEEVEEDTFGPYRILKVLGEGGMGTVYLAEQTEPIRRRVALKVVKLGMDTKQVLARFNHERQALARMEHSGIARILDAGASRRGRPFFVMDYIEGISITGYCDRDRLTTAQRLELFLPVCRAVQHTHDKGIVHRDLKPSNVLVTIEDGKPVPKVIDFGIARATDAAEIGKTFATQFGQMVGTPEYASPEQADTVPGEIGAATDVYSLGVVLYELLIGVVPFDGAMLRRAGFAEMLRIIREEEVPSLVQRLDGLGTHTGEIAARRGTGIGALREIMAGDLNRIVKKALAKAPSRRYPSPSGLAADIERHLKGEPVLAGPSRPSRRIRGSIEPRSNVVSAIVLSDLTNDTGDSSFDILVRQSISFELQRSATLKVLMEGRISETLSEMRRTADTRVTPEIAREIGQRTGTAAFIESSLCNADPGYLLTIRIRNCTDGGIVAQAQSRTAGKDDVLKQVRRLTPRLLSKSAGALITLQDSIVPLDAATTSSIEALKSFSAARQRYYESPSGALLLFQRAVELDPKFALAYAWLGRSYADAAEQSLAMENIRQAYRLRSDVSDRENLFITFNYYRDVLRNFELCRQLCESWIEKYPDDLTPHGFLSGLISPGTAQYEKAIREGETAIAMNPNFTIGYCNVALAYLALNRPDDVVATIQRAAERRLPTKDPFATLYFAAFLNRDRRAMDNASEQMAADHHSGDFEYYQSLVAAYEGRLQRSRQASIQAVTLALQARLTQRAALFAGAAAVTEALYGYPEEALRHSAAVARLASGRDVDFGPAFALALSGESESALAIVTRLEQEYPEDTCVQFSYAPAVRGLLAMNEGKPERAIQLLTVSKAYELAQTGVSTYMRYGAMYPVYVRGLAYKQLRQPGQAAAEFQQMLNHPGLLLADPIGPAARLQLARALGDSGDAGGARSAYTELLALWNEADLDIPLLQQAKSEFARL